MKEILKCENLNKYFGNKHVLKDVSFTINEGDILAFIGPNGSGKTTTIKSILGLQKMNSGSVWINGHDIEKDFTKAIEKVGAIVESPDMYMYLSGYQNLNLIAKCYEGISKQDIDELVKFVGLENRIHDKVSKYSLGMRQRLGIARALLNKPNILILDEPTNGLDPEGIKDLRDLLKKLAKEGMGILISSHNLAELESFCNKVCVISSGQILDISDVKEFKNVGDKYRVVVSSTKGLDIKDINIINDEIFIVNATKDEIAKIIASLVKKKIDVFEVNRMQLSLEEAFLRKTGGNKID